MIRLRATILSNGRRSAVLTLLGLLVATVLLAHGAAGMGHDSEQGDGMQTAMNVCLAVAQLSGGLLLIAALPGLRLHRRRNLDRPGWQVTTMLLDLPPVAGSARAGPAVLQVFRL